MDVSSFENFIMDCCRLPEWHLRLQLKKLLTEAGFSYKEDNYRTRRCDRNYQYDSVHNLLFTRGENPAVCLVAHTDVCRDHFQSGTGCIPPVVQPVIKEVKLKDDSIIRVIQDKSCEVQVGGDDRLGVAINVWIALNTGYDMSLLLTTDEEVGLISAEEVSFSEINNFKLFCQVDRGNRSHQLVTSISGRELIDPRLAEVLLSIANNMAMPRQEVDGMATDVYVIKGNNPKIQAVNMTCGYHCSHGAGPNEFIYIDEARDTMLYVSKIIQEFDLSEELCTLADSVIKENELESLMLQQKTERLLAIEFEAEETEDSEEARILRFERQMEYEEMFGAQFASIWED